MYRKLRLLLVLLIGYMDVSNALALHAESHLEYVEADDGYKFYFLKENGLVGILSATKDTIIRPEWDEICYTTDSYFEVYDSIHMGIYNQKGVCIIGNDRGYVFIYSITSDHCFAWVCHKDTISVSMLCNWKGEEVWAPQNKYSGVFPLYRGGYLLLLAQSLGQKYGIIDIYEHIIVPFEYDEIGFNLSRIFGINYEKVEASWILSGMPMHRNVFPKKNFNKIEGNFSR